MSVVEHNIHSHTEENPRHRSFTENLERRMAITRGVRFESEGRLQKKHLLSVLAVNVLSLCVIGFELISILVKTKTHTMELLFPVATIIAPVFIIVLAAHENAKRYLVHAERMNRSAQRISILHSELTFRNHTKTLTDDELNKIRTDYDAVLNDASSHHEDVDYKYYQSLHPKLFLEGDYSYFQLIKLYLGGRIPYHFNVWFVPIAAMLLPVGLLGASIWWLITNG